MTVLAICVLAATLGLIVSLTGYVLLKDNGVSGTLVFSRKTPTIYEDEDGKATLSTQNQSVDTPRKLAANLFVLIGLSVAFVSAVRTSTTSNGDREETFVVVSCWARVSAWLLVLAQCNVFYFQTPFLDSFNCGLYVALSTAVLLLDLIWESYELLLLYQQLSETRKLNIKPWLLAGSEIGAQATLGTLLLACCLGIPRRPVIFFGGRVVDAQFTVSLVKRYTFAWALPVLVSASRVLEFGLDDLPMVDFATRASTLRARFETLPKSSHERLWRIIYRLHRRTFWKVALLTVSQSAAAYMPHLCLYRILKLLELQQGSHTTSHELWFWAIGLGCVVLTQSGLDTWLEWFTVTRLEFPVRSQLSAIIFQKSMRMKDTKLARQPAPNHGNEKVCKAESFDGINGDDMQDATERLIPEEEKSSLPPKRASGDHLKFESNSPEPPSKSDQMVINLIQVDAPRVADFCCRCHVLLSSVAMLGIAIIVLIRLIGWVSLGVGLSVAILMLPINYKVSKAYEKAQVALMKHRDDRATVVTDALLGIRQIKFTAAEGRWQQSIMRIRDSELKQQRWVFIWIIGLRLYWIVSPILFSVASLAAYSWIHRSLSASVAFTALGIFGSLEMALSAMPFVISQLLETLVSCRRLEQHIYETEKTNYLTSGQHIKLEEATMAWPSEQPDLDESTSFKLQRVTASIPKGKFCVVYGKSGSGKSLLLNALVGEADLISGKIKTPEPSPAWNYSDARVNASNWIIPSTIAYLAQIPWLENTTIKENILYGSPFDPRRYEQVMSASAIGNDLDTLDLGDMTEIGSQGITLSGGQRFRIAFAKALYSRAEILVLDDIFSAVDARVGRHILEYGLLGELCRNRTVILATHHVSLCLPRAAHAIWIRENGLVEEINVDNRLALNEATQPSHLPICSSEDCGPQNLEIHDLCLKKSLSDNEFRETGIVRWPVYARYIRSSGGYSIWVLAVAVIIASQAALLGRGWWMQLWTRWSLEQTNASHMPRPPSNSTKHGSHDMRFYLGFYIVISLSAALFEALKCAVVYIGALRASRRLFEDLCNSVLRARLRWLDITPLGRILNRLTADFVLIDTRIPGDTHTLCSALLALLASLAAGLSVTIYLLIPELILSALSLGYTARYLRAAREIKRLDSVLKSPILNLFSVALLGRSTIRAYRKVEVYERRMYGHLDNLSRASWSFAMISAWTSLRLGAVGSFFAMAIAITTVWRNVDASLAGFALTFSLELMKKMGDAIRRYSSLQLNMNSTERVVEFCDIETEKSIGSDAPEDWPFEASISIKNLRVGYAPELPDVLRNLSFEIAPRERIGIVGRTGAGKSSFSLAMLRMLEARSGSIHVDGIDISTVKLDHLRARLAIIPQDPILFSGTVRSNLDPSGQLDDRTLRDSLRRVHLLDSSANASIVDVEKRSVGELSLFHDLETKISESGGNLSQGQRQLLCLARAVINQCKIMIMDEATSAVDMHTDALIQETIKEQFPQSTLIVIAHRLSTVADFDKILVMAGGEGVEFGTPRDLLERKGEFSRLVDASGEKEKVQAIIKSQ